MRDQETFEKAAGAFNGPSDIRIALPQQEPTYPAGLFLYMGARVGLIADGRMGASVGRSQRIGIARRYVKEAV